MKRSAILVVAMCSSAAASPAVELAGTLSGKTPDPETGIRASVVVPVSATHGAGELTVELGLLARFDSHGAPAETGAMYETQADSLGIGLRGAIRNASPSYRYAMFLDVTAGRTMSRGDAGIWESAGHTMIGLGFLFGPAHSHFSGVFDFDWMFTKVGDGRIGPIASLGLNVTL